MPAIVATGLRKSFGDQRRAGVPTDTMPAGMRAFAENQPFTPIIETVRGPAR